MFWAHAEDAPDSQPTLEESVALREASVRPTTEPAKKATRIPAGQATAEPLTADVQALATNATFTAITPYRAFDSREYDDGFLVWGESVFFDVITDVNSSPKIPATAVAVTYNLTVTGTVGVGGYLAVFPGGTSWPGNSSINWFTGGLDLSNGGVSALGFQGGPGTIVVLAGSVPGTGTDYIVDVTGYYQ